MSRTFLVIAESRGGKLRQVTFEALKAAQLSAAEGDLIAAAVVGSHAGSLAAELSGFGADKIYTIEHKQLEQYNPEAWFAAVRQIIEAAKPDAVYAGHTAIGKDLLPMIAAYLNAGQISDVVGIDNSGAETVFIRPIYAGKAFEKKTFAGSPWVVTVRPNNIPAGEPVSGKTPEVIAVDYPNPTLRSVIKDVVNKTSGKVDLSEAKIIVSGGRGVKSAEGFKPLQEMAEVLGGAVGASRGACDAGYCDYALQIGQTGKVVTPEVYIACGISGAIQHLAGMSQSKVIIAINKDPEAPIFKVADYGIVGDLFEAVPMLTDEFKRILQN